MLTEYKLSDGGLALIERQIGNTSVKMKTTCTGVIQYEQLAMVGTGSNQVPRIMSYVALDSDWSDIYILL